MKSFRRPYRIKKRKSIFKNFYFWFSILILFFASCGIYFLFFSDFFSVKKIVISGEKRVNKEEIELFINNSLERKILIFQTRNIFLIDLDQIKSKILERFTEIDNLEFKRKFPDTLNMKIHERKEIAKFCQNDNCFLVDEKGIIFKEIASEIQLLKIENEALKGDLKLGEKIFDKELITKILEVEKKLKDLKVGCEKVLIVSEDNLHFKTNENWEIFVDAQKDIDWQMTKLSVSLKEAIPKEKRNNLEYIDLRFGNFAYPKYKD